MSAAITSPEAVGMSSSRLDRLRPIMQSYVEERGVVGISTMISRRGPGRSRRAVRPSRPGSRPADDRRHDLSDLLDDEADRVDRADAAARGGPVPARAPGRQYLPAFGPSRCSPPTERSSTRSGRSTIRDVLTHTSGLTYDFMIDTPVAQMYRDHNICHDATRTLEAMIDELATLPLASQPGSDGTTASASTSLPD